MVRLGSQRWITQTQLKLANIGIFTQCKLLIVSKKIYVVIEAEYNKQKDILCMNDVLVLLKLVAIKTFGRQTVAELYGDEYLHFLEEKGDDTPFRKYTDTISGIVYNSGEIEKTELANIIALTKKWIKTHA